MGVLHLFSIKNIFYDKMDLGLFYFYVANWMVFDAFTEDELLFFLFQK